jgi:hypothetical protein
LPAVRRAFVTTLAALAGAAPAQAGHPDLWATVNICDTEAFPNAMGVRASMPGNGTRQRMYMRFRAAFYDRGRDAWHPVTGVGRSPWILAGNARFRARRAGWTFQFDPPAPGTDFIVRGVVEFQWRERRKPKVKGAKAREVVVDTAHANTRHGVPNVGEGDPPGTSEGLCVINP